MGGKGLRRGAVARRSTSLLVFLAIALAVYAVAFYIRSILPQVDRPELIAAGLTLDLVLLVPLVWYVAVVRRLGWSWLTLVPVLIASMVAAAQVVPASHHATLSVLELALVPLELALMAYIGWKAVRAVRRVRERTASASDAFDAIRGATRELVPSRRLADVVADEISIFYAGVAGWGPRRLDASHFTCYQRDAYASVVVGLLFAVAVELFPVHLLLDRWSPMAAWIVTALSLYGAFWLVADFQVLRHRPMRLTGEGFDLRVGLRWDVHIPFAAVERLERLAPGTKPQKHELKVSGLGEPLYRLALREPMAVRGMYGYRRSARVFLFTADEPARFEGRWVLLGGPALPDPAAHVGA